ncbi:MAG: CPBP family intramembrane metalloprotease, partial [Gammaproteobacteria bacterium]|nr:CPBP family intramembrane metalloprotease [Gammaproteobacteria bacterium]
MGGVSRRVSAWEEWVFRLALPYYVESQGGDLMIAVVGANLIFAVAHYFTLRWKWAASIDVQLT